MNKELICYHRFETDYKKKGLKSVSSSKCKWQDRVEHVLKQIKNNSDRRPKY